MPRLVFETVIACEVEDLWRFHASAEALRELTPPGARLQLTSPDLEVRNGALHEMTVRKMGTKMEWRARISDVQPPNQFRDTAEKSPFRSWTHLHEFLPHPNGAILRDTIDYELPFGPIGALADLLLIKRDLTHMFRYRHAKTKKTLERG